MIERLKNELSDKETELSALNTALEDTQNMHKITLKRVSNEAHEIKLARESLIAANKDLQAKNTSLLNDVE